ncbi:MAG: zf-HC2 domain-containing protein [Melioribacteraceae bacterium]
MYSENRAACREFEKEMWLFIADELPEDRMNFWKEHLSGCGSCLSGLEEGVKLSSVFKVESLVDLDDSRFNSMIENAAWKKRYNLKNFFGTGTLFGEKGSIYGKAAFAGSLAVIAIIISLATHQSIKVENIPREVLDWNDSGITTQIKEIKEQIDFMSEDNWDKQILLLDERIGKMENESDKFSFNK